MKMQGGAAFIEVLSEPLYILATVRLWFGVRVGCETAATLVKNGATLYLLMLRKETPVLAFSWGQMLYAVTMLASFVVAFLVVPTTTPAVGPSTDDEAASLQPSSSLSTGVVLELDRDILRLSGTFSLQAAGKLLMAEGSKAVLAAATPLQEQGVYGLVNNLGSLVVRTLFQPFEEVAFVAFSRPPSPTTPPHLDNDGKLMPTPPPPPPTTTPAVTRATTRAAEKEKRNNFSSNTAGLIERAALLSSLCRGISLIGALAAAFGPAYSHLVLLMLYGQRWAESGAPAALSVYSFYIALLSVNGILEAFVHAVADGRSLHQANMALLITSAVHTVLSVVTVRAAGAAGLLVADVVTMTLRILFCLWFCGRYFAEIGGLKSVELFARRRTRAALVSALLCTIISQMLFMPEASPLGGGGVGVFARQGWASSSPFAALSKGVRAAAHVVVGVVCLVGVSMTAYMNEFDVLAQLRPKKKQA